MRDLTLCYALIRRFEGCRLKAYQDQVGVWTIGYGTTEGVHSGMVIDQQTAESLMEKDVQYRAQLLTEWITVPVSDNEMDAMISLAYNIGLHAFHRSHLLFNLNSGHPKLQVADNFLSWIYAGGRVNQGLVNRRGVERSTFLV